MPRSIGFSTGSLNGPDFRSALAGLAGTAANAVELSALREPELQPLLDQLERLDLQQFRHVSLHAPSSLKLLSERALINLLEPLCSRGWPIIVHADLIREFKEWRRLGRALCIENMDKRKLTGRATWELAPLFSSLPEARFCLDFAHARQVDPTLCETVNLLHAFRDRLAQIHLSELNAQSRHEGLSFGALSAFRSIATLIPANTPIILEYAVQPHEIPSCLEMVDRLFPTIPRLRAVS